MSGHCRLRSRQRTRGWWTVRKDMRYGVGKKYRWIENTEIQNFHGHFCRPTICSIKKLRKLDEKQMGQKEHMGNTARQGWGWNKQRRHTGQNTLKLKRYKVKMKGIFMCPGLLCLTWRRQELCGRRRLRAAWTPSRSWSGAGWECWETLPGALQTLGQLAVWVMIR